MKRHFLVLLFFPIFLSCNHTPQKPVQPEPADKAQEPLSFFPVTSYIKGQIAGIKNNGVNPLKIDSMASNPRLDSVWLKMEDLDAVFYEFIHPEIDSVNLIDLFEESKFADQTLNTYTFTYTPKVKLPDSVPLLRWDVYIDEETNTVKRIFMVKKVSDGRELQLTWQGEKYCKTVSINTDKEGRQFAEHEQTIKWSFD